MDSDFCGRNENAHFQGSYSRLSKLGKWNKVYYLHFTKVRLYQTFAYRLKPSVPGSLVSTYNLPSQASLYSVSLKSHALAIAPHCTHMPAGPRTHSSSQLLLLEPYSSFKSQFILSQFCEVPSSGLSILFTATHSLVSPCPSFRRSLVCGAGHVGRRYHRKF